MEKQAYERPIVEVLTAEELFERIGVIECLSGQRLP